MKWLFCLSVMSSVGTLTAGDWSKTKAAEYLDNRQQAWTGFKAAQAAHGPCLSCHTGLGYLLARPALRQALKEPGVTPAESALVDGLKKRLATGVPLDPSKPVPGSVESVLAAVAFARTDSAEAALERMWKTQIREGEDKGAWLWFNLKLDPWETTDSKFLGAAWAAAAVSQAPAAYRAKPDVESKITDLMAYIERKQTGQPLHNRLALLWSEGKLMPKATRKAAVEEAWSKQGADGGWSLASIGPWAKAPREASLGTGGSDSYATAWTAASLLKGGAKKSDPRMKRALEWLRAHQDASTGAWTATSMNKDYPADSMMVKFMSDAASAYAVVALLD